LSSQLQVPLAPIKPANPGSTGKMAVKTERQRERENMYYGVSSN